MSNLFEKLNKHKIKIIICIIIIISTIFIINFVSKKVEEKRNNIDISNAIHGVIIEKDIVFYKKPKESKWIDIRKLDYGEFVYIVEEIVDKYNKEWYKVKAKDKVGFVLKDKVDYFEFSDKNGYELMSDVSKFNVIYKQFKNSEEYAAFLLNSNMNYAYIRLGGRGYGDEGNFYTDPEYQIFIDACEYIGMPYGFYYIDEAITSEEIFEEVEFVEKFIKENAKKNYKLPLVIDVEKHKSGGRADELWEERDTLLSELVTKFKEKNIETIIYSNANLANEYLYTVDSKFWISYYDLEKKVPKHWYTETDQEPVKNLEFMEKVVAWQFTETGAGDEINLEVDASIVKNEFFRDFVK